MDTLQLSVDRQGATGSRIADQGTQHARRPKAYVAAEPVSMCEEVEPVKEVVVEERSQVVMVKEQPCQLVRCLQCSGSHSHMFYCDQFIRSSPNERFQLVKESKSCTKCLKLGVQYNHSKRFDWWKSHKDSCHQKIL